MSSNPILLIGGSGIVGQWAGKFLRSWHPDAPLLIGGRDLAKASRWAGEIGQAEAVAIDMDLDDLGVGDRPVSAVATLFTDESLAALRFAQSRSAAHISISPGIVDIGPSAAAFMHAPDRSPVVLGTEWLVGATTIPALEFAKAFGQIDSVVIGAVLDEEDAFGPAAAADLERHTENIPTAFRRRDGAYEWETAEGAKSSFRAVDGTKMDAEIFAPYDVLGIAAETGAPNVEFRLALGISSTRRAGGPMSTEIIIDIRGRDRYGNDLRTRRAIVHPEGQMPLTGFGVAMVLERLAGLDGKTATGPGLYFPYQLIDPDTYFARLTEMGGRVSALEIDAPRI